MNPGWFWRIYVLACVAAVLTLSGIALYRTLDALVQP